MAMKKMKKSMGGREFEVKKGKITLILKKKPDPIGANSKRQLKNPIFLEGGGHFDKYWGRTF